MRKINPFWKRLNFFNKAEPLNEHYERSPLDRRSEKYYRKRWQHDETTSSAVGRYSVSFLY